MPGRRHGPISRMVVEFMCKVVERSSARREPGVTAAWINGLSTERYKPMSRLLDNSDMQFLYSQPGYHPRQTARLRKQRQQIFGCYLKSLGSDFRQTCDALRLLMRYSQKNRPDLARLLARKQLAFAFCMLRARVRLLLHRWGIGCVDAGCLMSLFDSVCAELQALAPARASV